MGKKAACLVARLLGREVIEQCPQPKTYYVMNYLK